MTRIISKYNNSSVTENKNRRNYDLLASLAAFVGYHGG